MNLFSDSNAISSLSFFGYFSNPFVLTFEGEDYLFTQPGMMIQRNGELFEPNSEMPIHPDILLRNRVKPDWTKATYFGDSPAIVNTDRLVNRCFASQEAFKIFVSLVLKVNETQSARLTMKDCLFLTGFKNEETAQEHFRELMDLGVIARARFADLYWVNPLFMCYGGRFTEAWEYTGPNPYVKEH